MNLAELARVSALIAGTRSRREKVQHLAACLGALHADEIPVGVAWLGGDLTRGRIGIGPAALRETMTGPALPGPPLLLLEVDLALGDLARRSGPGSAEERKRILAGVMARATPQERDFLARLLLGELRQGALEPLVAEALAKAAAVPLLDLRRALMLGERGAVARAALSEGLPGLARFALRVFQPVQPMLAQSAASVGEALAQLDGAALEYKLDGARIQVHRSGADVRVFSRGLNDVTRAVPEVVERVLALPAAEVVLDGEALALLPDGRPQPFQTTMRRFGRRLDVDRMRSELPLSPFFFDLIFLDGQSLLDAPAGERAAALQALAPEEMRIPRLVTGEEPEAERFLAGALAAGHEGIMAKAIAAGYAAGSRGAAWLKVKPAHTLDLVVLAAEWGNGRRQGWLSNLHLGARDPDAAGFVMLGKTFKGMTDALLEWQTRRLLAIETGRDGHVVHVRPELVVEVAFDGVQRSSQYPGGVALRFARVKRYREDKTAGEADTIATVRALAGVGDE